MLTEPQCPYAHGTSMYHSWWMLELAKATREASIALQFARERRKRLLAVKHGHDFGYDRRCKCGVTEIEYHMIRPDEDQPICHLS